MRVRRRKVITLNPTIDSAATTRLGILYPPTGSEFEYYTAAEAMRPPARAYVVGVRIAGGAREHEPRHLRQTASVDNLLLSARALAPVKPHSVMWACTSGSFIDGLDFARKQAAALARELGVPASSTSLAFLAALERFGIGRVAVLASYPRPAARAFAAFLAQGGVEVADMVSLGAPSGPDAARLGAARLVEAAGRLRIPRQGALLVPDTAMPILDVVNDLENRLDRVVLGANQVTLWQGLRLAGGRLPQAGLGRLFSAATD